MSVSTLYAVVLAAGSASRFGSTKQLAVLDGQTLAGRAMRRAEAVCGERSLLVVGNDWQRVADACSPLRGFMVMNPLFASGMSSSLTAGIRAISDVAAGALLLLADQPLVSGTHLASLARTWQESPESICVSEYAGTTGPPVIFPASLFPQLTALQGDRGAREVIDGSCHRTIRIRHEPAAVDIDSPSDLAGIQGGAASG